MIGLMSRPTSPSSVVSRRHPVGRRVVRTHVEREQLLVGLLAGPHRLHRHRALALAVRGAQRVVSHTSAGACAR